MAIPSRSKSHILLILPFIFLLNVHIEAQSRGFKSASCIDRMPSNPESKTFRYNRNTALSSLLTTNSGHGFYNTSVGVGKDAANAILLCRGDVDQTTCHSCLNDSIVELTQICPNASEADIRYDDCYFRFSNKTIPPYTSYQYSSASWSHRYNIGNYDHFKRVLRSFFDLLRNEAASGGSLLKFATGNMSLADSMEISRAVSSGNSSEMMDLRSIYGLVQCIPDLSMEECDDCLEESFMKIMDLSNGSIDARIVSQWCHLRYSNVLFYNDTPVIRTSSPVTLVSSASCTSSQSGSKLRSRWLI